MADDTTKKKSRKAKATGRRPMGKGPTLHAAETPSPSRPRRRVSLPLVRSKHPGTLALDNVTIFEIIPFP